MGGIGLLELEIRPLFFMRFFVRASDALWGGDMLMLVTILITLLFILGFLMPIRQELVEIPKGILMINNNISTGSGNDLSTDVG